MNPFQRAREEALKLRKRFLGNRAELSVHVDELLNKIEPELNIGIEKLPQQASALGKGDACLRREERYIYIRNDIKEEQSAALIAHELGHWILDVDKAEQVITSLSLLENTQGSPGLITVEAYGAREREELQANVFAREFLLPRQVARNLFESGSGPDRITKDIGIPLSITQQQILDAILLPQAKPYTLKELSKPSNDQAQAAFAKEKFVNVVSGPGTGKTSTLIHRTKYLVEKLKVDPSHILVLTFTNKAAFELVERLRSTGVERASEIWAGTFHGFGLEFLRKYHQLFGLHSDLLIADKLNSITILAKELPNIPLQGHLRVEDPYTWLGTVVAAIYRLKEELVTPQEYRKKLAQVNQSEKPELASLRQDTASLYEVHDRLLRNANLVDFADLVALPTIAIRDNRKRFSALADRFQYILVDEYQDVTKAMVHMIIELSRKAKSLWVVGDVRQAIHHWRGASVKSLIRFDDIFREHAEKSNSLIQKYTLKSNWRSSKEIVKCISVAGESHILQNRLPLDKTVSTLGNLGHTPQLVSCQSRSDIPEVITRKILTAQSNGILFSEQATLCRRSADVEALAEILHKNGVPILYISKITNRPSVKKLLSLMHLLAERQPRALIGLTSISNLKMPLQDINKILDWAGQDVNWQRGRWLGKAADGLSIETNKVILRLTNLLKGQNYHANPWNFICNILLEKRFDILSLDDQSIDAQVERLAIWQFAYSTRVGDGDKKRLSISRYLLRRKLRQQIGENFIEREMPNEASELDAVRVQTVHGSKGLEYQAVHVGYVDGAFSQKKPWAPENAILDLIPPEILGSSYTEFESEQAIERNNLFYVAVSRAKTQLYFYEDGEFSGSNRPPQFLEMPVLHIAAQSEPPPKDLENDKTNQNNSSFGGSFSFEEFDTYARCPLQYWYRFGLDLKREQELEVPSRARFSIMQALRSVASGAVSNGPEALKENWKKNALPSEIEDPTLWIDATTVFNRGLKIMSIHDISFLEPTIKIDGINIQMPWLIRKTEQNRNTYKIIRFSHRGARQICTLLRPMILFIDEGVTVELVNLLTADTIQATPSRSIQKTKVMKTIHKLKSGDSQPIKGRHCAYCSYVSICPENPSL